MPQAQQEKPKSQSLNRFQVLENLPSNQPKQTFAQRISSSQNQQYVDKAHTMKVQVLEPFQISFSNHFKSTKLGYLSKVLCETLLMTNVHKIFGDILIPAFQKTVAYSTISKPEEWATSHFKLMTMRTTV